MHAGGIKSWVNLEDSDSRKEALAEAGMDDPADSRLVHATEDVQEGFSKVGDVAEEGYKWYAGGKFLGWIHRAVATARGITNPAITKLPVPGIPRGFTTSEFGRNVIGWGRGAEGAAARTQSLNLDAVAQMQAQGLTRAMATEWRAFYANEFSRNANNLAARNRVELMDAILNLMK